MPAQLTVLIPCLNEVANLRACIASARLVADEVLVADSGSTDGTLQLAHALADRVIEREFVCDSDFKNWAIPQAAHGWVLVLDADERISPALAAEIRQVLTQPAEHDGYAIAFRTFMLGHELRHGGWSSTTSIRLFRRNCRYQTLRVHADIDLPPRQVGKLQHKLLHYTYWSLEQYLEKFNRYTTAAARDAAQARVKPSVLRLLTHPPAHFVKVYFLRGGILDGVPGLMMATLSTYYRFVKYAKLWALRYGKQQILVEAAHKPPESAIKKEAA